MTIHLKNNTKTRPQANHDSLLDLANVAGTAKGLDGPAAGSMEKKEEEHISEFGRYSLNYHLLSI